MQLCLALRKEKFDGAVIMYGAEQEYPYHRPPLSKGYITGKDDDSKIAMRPASFYSGRSIDLRLADEVESIDLAERSVTAGSGSQSYDYLVLATGASPRHLQLPGSDLNGVNALRSIEDARQIKKQLEQASSVVIVGAGFIGLEIAATAALMGKEVAVFDLADRVMARAVAPQISDWFENTHRQSGVRFFFGESITGIEGIDGNVSAVRRADGSNLQTQLVIIGIGVVPNTGLAEAAGIYCDNGIVVNEYCKTSQARIFAAGDCANHPNRFAQGASVRLESVQNATDQARVIAAAIAGKPKPYDAIPWFWSDQGANSLQMAGLGFGADQFITRGDPADNSFSVFHFKDSQLLAVDSVNHPRDHMLARKLITAGVSLSPEEASATDFDLKSALNRA